MIPGFAPEHRGGGGGGGGAGGAPTVYTHTQPTPASVWNIQHNIGARPVSLVTLDGNGDRVMGEEDWPASTLNLMVVRFGQPVAGVAWVTW
jgi:hypothetical protein